MSSDSLDAMKEPVSRTLSAVSLEGIEGAGVAGGSGAAAPAAKRKGRFNIVAEEASEGAKVRSVCGLLGVTAKAPRPLVTGHCSVCWRASPHPRAFPAHALTRTRSGNGSPFCHNRPAVGCCVPAKRCCRGTVTCLICI